MASYDIFRSYDIRGIFGKDMEANDAEKIGYALAKHAKTDIVVAMDMRSSSAAIRKELSKGVTTAGSNVDDIGLVPMGVAMFYAWRHGKVLAYVTASHLSKEWAGIKFFHASGMGFSEKENYTIRDLFFSLKKIIAMGKKGAIEIQDSDDAINDYIIYLTQKLKAEKRLKVALDCGNGMASVIGKRLFQEAGFDVHIIYGTLSDVPERNSEPNIDPLTVLREAEKDIGIAYDGDADRMIIVDGNSILPAEKSSYLILSQLSKEEKGDIVANIECSLALDDVAKKFNKTVHRQPVGHTFLVENAREKAASFGVESSGHYIIPSLVPFDDALAVSLYAAVALSKSASRLSEIVRNVNSYPFVRVNFDCPDDRKFAVIEKLKNEFSGYNINNMDGLRIDFGEAWILIRASNTSPMIRLTVEAKEQEPFERLKSQFTEVLENAIKEQ